MFQRIMKEKPEVMNKIYPVWGELSKPNFDMSQEHLRRVIDTTEIVFHMAAYVKLSMSLKSHVMMNLVGTKNALELSKLMKNLVQMVHLSTAFCNVQQDVVYEKVYDFSHEPDDLIRMSEWMNDEAMEAIQKELLGEHPNTYTYTKRLAEVLVQREYENGLMVCIARPSIVMPSWKEPMPGWVDSLNGLVGIFYAAGKGVLRSMLANPEGRFEFIPVDIATNAIVLIPKILSTVVRSKEIPVYHLTCNESQKISVKRLMELVKTIGRKYPMAWALWYPDGSITMNPYENAIKVFLFQLVPAYIIDFFLFCFGQNRL
jgi:alcohol-forming fatty acyl-CoA reductase